MPTLDVTIRDSILQVVNYLRANNLLPSVQHQHITTNPPTRDEYGLAAVGAAVARECLIEPSNKQFIQADSTVVVAVTRLTFLEDVDVHAEDVITLPDGETAPILIVDRAILDTAGNAFLVQVYLGPERRAQGR